MKAATALLTMTMRRKGSRSLVSATCCSCLLFMGVVVGVSSAFLTPKNTVRGNNRMGVSFLPAMVRTGNEGARHASNNRRMDVACFFSGRPRLLQRRTVLFQKDSSDSEQESDLDTNNSSSADNNDSNSSRTLDRILSNLTSCFPLFVVVSAVVGLQAPSCLTWVNKGSLITIMLASVMMGTGMTLEKKDFTSILDKNAGSVPAGVLCQYTIMPFAAWLVGRTMLLPVSPALFLGLALVGCSPGGTASNLVSLIAGANVALSVLLTACSTVLAAIMTPLLVKLLIGNSSISVSGLALCSATARVVLLPVILGMALNQKAPKLAKQASRFTPFRSVLLVALICGGVVADNASTLLLETGGGGGASLLLPRIVTSVLLLHMLGFTVGYMVPKYLLGYSSKTARTTSIETGMQNSALAVVLARSVGAPPLASLPGALSATAHSCLGSILAAYWRVTDNSKNTVERNEGE